jgi:hypothetical protein
MLATISIQSLLPPVSNTKNTYKLKQLIIILFGVLYGCETWSLALRGQHRWTFENRVLRRIFGSKREEVTGSWRNVHNDKLHNLYSSPITKNENMIGGACST